jgi:hypothetical protein
MAQGERFFTSEGVINYTFELEHTFAKLVSPLVRCPIENENETTAHVMDELRDVLRLENNQDFG